MEIVQTLISRLQNLRAQFTRSGMVNIDNEDALKTVDELLSAIGRGDQITPQHLTDYVEYINQIRFKKVSADGTKVRGRTRDERRAMNQVFDVLNEANEAAASKDLDDSLWGRFKYHISKFFKFHEKALVVLGLIIGLFAFACIGPVGFPWVIELIAKFLTHVFDILCTPLASLTIGKILLLHIYAGIAYSFWYFIKCLMGDEDD